MSFARSQKPEYLLLWDLLKKLLYTEQVYQIQSLFQEYQSWIEKKTNIWITLKLENKHPWSRGHLGFDFDAHD